jgi:hypothetical protein
MGPAVWDPKAPLRREEVRLRTVRLPCRRKRPLKAQTTLLARGGAGDVEGPTAALRAGWDPFGRAATIVDNLCTYSWPRNNSECGVRWVGGLPPL